MESDKAQRRVDADLRVDVEVGHHAAADVEQRAGQIAGNERSDFVGAGRIVDIDLQRGRQLAVTADFGDGDAELRPGPNRAGGIGLGIGADVQTVENLAEVEVVPLIQGPHRIAQALCVVTHIHFHVHVCLGRDVDVEAGDDLNRERFVERLIQIVRERDHRRILAQQQPIATLLGSVTIG